MEEEDVVKWGGERNRGKETMIYRKIGLWEDWLGFQFGILIATIKCFTYTKQRDLKITMHRNPKAAMTQLTIQTSLSSTEIQTGNVLGRKNSRIKWD